MVMLQGGSNQQGDFLEDDGLFDAIDKQDSDSDGEYSEYIRHLRGLASGSVTNIKAMMSQCEFKDPKDREYVTSLLDNGEYQLLSEAAMREYLIDDAEVSIERLTEEIKELSKQVRKRSEVSPIVKERKSRVRAGKLKELNELEEQLGKWLQDRRRDRAEGVYYSAKPFIEFFKQSEEDRRGMSYSHLMPPELCRAETVMAGFVSAGAAWYVHNQAIAAQMLTGAAMGRNIGFHDLAALSDTRPGRRGMGGRMRRPGMSGGAEEQYG